MTDCDQSAFLAAARSHTPVLRAQVAVLSMASGPRRFGQGTPQPTVPFRRTVANTLARRFFIAGTHSGPRTQVVFISESANVPAHPRQHVLDRQAVPPRNFVQTLPLFVRHQ